MPEKSAKVSYLIKIFYLILVLAAINILLQFVFTSMTEKGEPVVISHRGAAAIAPENTMAGVRAGVEAEAPFIEIDVQMTKDGMVVLMHDSTVDRTTDGSGKLRGLELEYLQSLDAGSWFSDEFSGEAVPTLDQILSYMKDKPSTLVIEVKSPGSSPGIEEAISDALKEYGMEKSVVLISFYPGWIERAGKLMPDTTLGVLYIYPVMFPDENRIEYANVFWPSIVLDPTLVWRLKRKGFTVWSWNIDSYLVARFLTWKGVSGITLDRHWLIDGR